MQRLFTMFPAGLPGLALLALRASVAVALLVDAYLGGGNMGRWLQPSGLVVAGALGVGFLTPLGAVAALLLHAITWSMHGVDGFLAPTIVVLDALALSLLGPGAYSIDAYRFGRRVVVLPPP